jgi:hypothetical protein
MGRLLAELSCLEAAVLVDDETLARDVGRSRGWLRQRGDMPLLPFLMVPSAGSVRVDLLDVNEADAATLRRIPGLDAAAVDGLRRGRPYFTLEEAVAEAATASLGRFCAAPSYTFLDKPARRRRRFEPRDIGVIAVGVEGVPFRALHDVLVAEGFRLLANGASGAAGSFVWDGAGPTRPARVRLVTTDAVASLGPFLRDGTGLTRLFHPFQLEVRLHESAPAEQARLLAAHRLSLLHQYEPGYFAARVPAPRHGLGRLYRMLDRLTDEPKVAFAEPLALPGEPG